MRVLDLFSGIGGFSLGLERAGMQTVAFCEIEKYPRRVLAKHWPGVPVFHDIQELTGEQIRRAVGAIDLICGGFPCQDISLAGRGTGITGARSGLWIEYARLIGEVGPRWVIIENVSALRTRGLFNVLCDLRKIGYDAIWDCIPASAVGAPHQRDRIWIVAHPNGFGLSKWQGFAGHIQSQLEAVARGCLSGGGRDHWAVEPRVGRMAHGSPSRVDRIKCLGNSVVPQIPGMIGRAILAAEESEI